MNRTEAPKVHGFGKLILSPADTYRLPNGIRLHVVCGGEVEVNRLTIALPGGEAESPFPGLASCATMMLAEGTDRHTGEEIANRLEYNGAWLNTSVSTHYSSISLSSLNDKFESLLPLIIEIILCPSFPAAACERILERQASRNELDREKVTFLADEAVRKMAYGDENPLSRCEDAAMTRAFTPGSLSAFHFSRLDPQDIHLFFAGKISDSMIDAVKFSFSRIPSAPIATVFTPLLFPAISPETRRTDIHRAHSKQSAVKMMIPAIGRSHPDFVALRATVTALGGYFGSRLMLNIREDKGLTYGISAVLLGYTDRSFITISTQTDASTVEEVIRLIGHEMEEMKNPSTYTSDEVKRLSGLLLSNLATILDTPFSRMDFHQTRIYADTPADYFERQEEIARQLSRDMLADMARRYFDNGKALIATVGA